MGIFHHPAQAITKSSLSENLGGLGIKNIRPSWKISDVPGRETWIIGITL